MRKWLNWQTSRILLSAALVPSALAGVALSATQASAQSQPLGTSTTAEVAPSATQASAQSQSLGTSTTTVQATPDEAGAGQTVIPTAEVNCPADPGAQDIASAGNGNTDCAASDATTPADVTATPIISGFPGIVPGGIGKHNIYYILIQKNNYTWNTINSYNKKSSIKSGDVSVANSTGNGNKFIKKNIKKMNIKVIVKPKRMKYWQQ